MKKQKTPAFSADLGTTGRRKRGGSKLPKPIIPGDKAPRTKTKRRRRIDPATRAGPHAGDDAEFITAMDHYKRDNRRPFPTWSETLEVLHALGYRRVAEPTKLPAPSAAKMPKAKT